VHEIQGSNHCLMHILSKFFVRAYTLIYRHIPTYTFICLHILSIVIIIPGTYKNVQTIYYVYHRNSGYIFKVHGNMIKLH
jgi:hypothetical protein